MHQGEHHLFARSTGLCQNVRQVPKQSKNPQGTGFSDCFPVLPNEVWSVDCGLMDHPSTTQKTMTKLLELLHQGTDRESPAA